MASALTPEKIILGIDPGTMVMGYGVIREQGKKMELITMGVINLRKLENQALKLKKIFVRLVKKLSLNLVYQRSTKSLLLTLVNSNIVHHMVKTLLITQSRPLI